ncbi:MAG: hypothetical protein IKE30_08045 [Clostridia bacterium]|nr:hypothetical protein [Clostridia bacterium]
MKLHALMHLPGILLLVFSVISCAGVAESAPSVGDTVTMGAYAGEPVTWRVLAEDGDKRLLISEYGLETKPYNNRTRNVTWAASTLRAWLNGKFLEESFSKEERMRIVRRKIHTPDPDRESSDAYGGEDSLDSVFLLSIDEAEMHFVSDTDRAAKPTNHALRNGAETFTAFDAGDLDDADDPEEYAEYTGNCFWWLRTPGSSQDRAAIVTGDGEVDVLGWPADTDCFCVRPVIWVNGEP